MNYGLGIIYPGINLQLYILVWIKPNFKNSFKTQKKSKVDDPTGGKCTVLTPMGKSSPEGT